MQHHPPDRRSRDAAPHPIARRDNDELHALAGDWATGRPGALHQADPADSPRTAVQRALLARVQVSPAMQAQARHIAQAFGRPPVQLQDDDDLQPMALTDGEPVHDEQSDEAEPMDESRELMDGVLGPADLDEDDADDPDYVSEMEDSIDDEEVDEGLDDESAAPGQSPTDATLAPLQPEMSLDERRAVEQVGLKRPFETTTLTPSKGRYPTELLKTRQKFKRDGEKTIEQRTIASGEVTITLEEVDLWENDQPIKRKRPIQVQGRIEPTGTEGRGGAPNPVSGNQIYMGGKGLLKESVQGERNQGMPDAERGHIMALELGGPDIPENIVPQWAKFQGSGVWRKMETQALATARELQKGWGLQYEVTVFYKDSGVVTPTLKTFGVPTGFKVTTQVLDASGKPQGDPEQVFNQGQAQDETDQMLAEREMKQVDDTDWDQSLDRGKAKKARPASPLKGALKPKRTIGKRGKGSPGGKGSKGGGKGPAT